MTFWKLYTNTLKRNARLLMLVCAALCFVVVAAPSALAASYGVERQVGEVSNVTAGTIVTGSSDTTTVRLAGKGDGQRVLGAVMATDKGSLADGTVGVALSGVNSVLVSDINGDIKSGDRIAVSSIDGVGMKSEAAGWIIGIAQADFATSSADVVRQQVEPSDGRPPFDAAVKALPVLLSVSHYSPNSEADGVTTIATTAQSVVEAVTGKSVSSKKAIIAMAVLGIALILLVTLVYSAVRSSLLAIGRNPLAGGRIDAGLMKVLLTAVIVVVVTLIAIYIILR